MSKAISAPPQSNHKKTRREVQNAIREVRQAFRPRRKPQTRKPKQGNGTLSWLLGLTAGGIVLWNGLKTVQHDAALPHDLPALAPAASTTAAKAAQDSTKTEAESSAKAESVTGLVALAKEFWKRFNDDECFTRAYALAFILVLSLVPLLLFALAIMGFLIKSPEQAADYTRQMISNLLPGEQAGQAANDFIQQAHITESAQTLMNGKVLALLGGVLSLVWAAIGLFVSASDPMNRAWDVKETRSFVSLRLTALGVFVAAFAVFALSLFVTSAAHGALAMLGLPKDMSPVLAFFIDLLFFALAAVVNAGMFTVIYRFLPNAPVTWKASAFGGLIVGALLEVFKQGFAVYLAHFGNFNKLYGAFGGIFLLVTWISYSCLLLLAGAIVCKMYNEHKESGGVNRKPSANPA